LCAFNQNSPCFYFTLSLDACRGKSIITRDLWNLFFSFSFIEINVVYRADIISMGDGKQG
jgi:hypothetical protein